MDECDEIAALALARVSLADNRVEESLTFLEPVSLYVQAAGHTDALIHALVLTAIAWQSKPVEPGQETEQSIRVLTALEEALRPGRSGGYVRVFLDDGRPILMLLTQWVAPASPGLLRDYAIQLLSNFKTELSGVDQARAERLAIDEMHEKPL